MHLLTPALMTAVILAFTALKFLGASETGAVGNIITVTKICILGVFVLFGIAAMARMGAGLTHFTPDFLPNGFGGVIQAMGLSR